MVCQREVLKIVPFYYICRLSPKFHEGTRKESGKTALQNILALKTTRLLKKQLKLLNNVKNIQLKCKVSPDVLECVGIFSQLVEALNRSQPLAACSCLAMRFI